MLLLSLEYIPYIAYNFLGYAGVAQLFRVRNASGITQGHLTDLKLVSSKLTSGSQNETYLARPRKHALQYHRSFTSINLHMRV